MAHPLQKTESVSRFDRFTKSKSKVSTETLEAI